MRTKYSCLSVMSMLSHKLIALMSTLKPGSFEEGNKKDSNCILNLRGHLASFSMVINSCKSFLGHSLSVTTGSRGHSVTYSRRHFDVTSV